MLTHTSTNRDWTVSSVLPDSYPKYRTTSRYGDLGWLVDRYKSQVHLRPVRSLLDKLQEVILRLMFQEFFRMEERITRHCSLTNFVGISLVHTLIVDFPSFWDEFYTWPVQWYRGLTSSLARGNDVIVRVLPYPLLIPTRPTVSGSWDDRKSLVSNSYNLSDVTFGQSRCLTPEGRGLRSEGDTNLERDRVGIRWGRRSQYFGPETRKWSVVGVLVWGRPRRE